GSAEFRCSWPRRRSAAMPALGCRAVRSEASEHRQALGWCSGGFDRGGDIGTEGVSASERTGDAFDLEFAGGDLSGGFALAGAVERRGVAGEHLAEDRCGALFR